MVFDAETMLTAFVNSFDFFIRKTRIKINANVRFQNPLKLFDFVKGLHYS